MTIIFFTIIGIALFGGNFVQIKIFSIPLFYIITLLSSFSIFINVYTKIKNYKMHYQTVKLAKGEMLLLYLVLYALFRVVLSYFGITDFLISDNIRMNKGYILRQAYYLLFFGLLVTADYSDEYIFILKFLKKYGNFIFFLVYIGSMLLKHSFSINVSTTFFLCFLSIFLAKEDKFPFIGMLILLTPLSTDGELTIIFIKTLYLLCIVKQFDKTKIYNIMKNFFCIFISLCFILPIFHNLLSDTFDANTFWRLEYWYDEISELKKSFFMGVGYGTSYASSNFVNTTSVIAGGPFSENKEYSTYDKLFVVGPHSSIISLAFRLGILGCYLLFSYLTEKSKKLLHNNEIDKCKLYLFFSSIFIITVNVGFESPYYLLIFVFSMYMCSFSEYKINSFTKEGKINA